MMPAIGKPRALEDQVTVYHDRTWEQFKHLQQGLEGTLGVRLAGDVLDLWTNYHTSRPNS